MPDIVPAALDRYILDLLPPREAVIAEMEAYAAEHDVPIVGPAVGTLLEILTRSIGADRVFELGSAIGYSTAFFARAVGRGGQVTYTDGSAEKAGAGPGIPGSAWEFSTASRSAWAMPCRRSTPPPATTT